MIKVRAVGIYITVVFALTAALATSAYAEARNGASSALAAGNLPHLASFPAPAPLLSSETTPPPAFATLTAASANSLLADEKAVLTRRGISPARASQAIGVESKVARTDLARKIEVAMGRAYAGLWFEPTAAQLHIGVTSPAGRRAAAGVVARAGLAADVIETPVRSTWGELLATQNRWNRRLAGLFEREDVETALVPERNAISVTLSSSVPLPERAVIEREASTADVNVVVSVTPSPQLSATPQSNATKCKEFSEKQAYCNKSITSGVRIESGNGEGCTAGPLTIPRADKSETTLLTAGHCIKSGGGVGEIWYAFNYEGMRQKIGTAKSLIENTEGDYGAIQVEQSGYWVNSGNPPVYALTAEWKQKEEKSYPVKGERTPIVSKQINCHEGQSTGESCGSTSALNVTVAFPGVTVGGLVEEMGATGKKGDSGGPWLFVEENKEALMEGTHVGELGNGNLVYEPLSTITNALNLELLTTANEVRPRGHEYLIEQSELISSEAVEGEGQNSSLESRILGTAISLTCQEELSTGIDQTKGESTFKVEFKNCYVVERSNGKRVFLTACTVAEPVTAEGTGKLIEHSVDEFKGEFNKEKGVFSGFEIIGEKCALKGKYKVTGSQVCTMPEAEFEKVTHRTICTPAASRLVFGTGEKTEQAQLSVDDLVRLKSLKRWAAT
jgi:hypothetical protein